MKRDWKQVTFVFIVGVLVGAALVVRCAGPGFHKGSPMNAEKKHQHMMGHFTTRLQLSPDQRDKVSSRGFAYVQRRCG